MFLFSIHTKWIIVTPFESVKLERMNHLVNVRRALQSNVKIDGKNEQEKMLKSGRRV